MRGLIAIPVVVAVVIACASTSPEIPFCGPLAEQPPLAVPDECSEAEQLDAEKQLSDLLVSAQSPLLLRVAFGQDATVRSVCVERGSRYDWSARRGAAEQLENARGISGPSCLANKRIDLNRRGAKLATIKEAELRCGQQVGTATRTGGGSSKVVAWQLRRCMAFESDWLILPLPGSTQALVFGKPETLDPPTVRASDTMSRCNRKALAFEDRLECVRSEGWEQLR